MFKGLIVLLVGLMGTPAENVPVKERYTRFMNFKPGVVLDALTVYNPTVQQCDATPLITASNSFIDTTALRSQQFRWLALSRDLLKLWGGTFSYGDTVLVMANDPAIDGLWIVKDTMNSRYKMHGDLLFHSNVRNLGKWYRVKLLKVETILVPDDGPETALR